MYAIVFDLEDAVLKQLYVNPSTGQLAPQSYKNAWATIGNELAPLGFTRQQRSVYFGNAQVTAVTCVLAVQDLTKRFSWFGPSVKDIRMLRIEDLNDLMPAILAIDPNVQQTAANARAAAQAAAASTP